MKTCFPSYPGAHVAAFLGVAALHAGLAAWQSMPLARSIATPQQALRVSLVSPVRFVSPSTAPTQQPPVEMPKKATLRPSASPALKNGLKQKKEAPAVTAAAPLEVSSETVIKTHALQSAAVIAPVAADYLQNPPPSYPRAALRRKTEGTVMLDVRVGTSGHALHVALERSSGSSLLDEAALKAVRSWRFVPARRGNEVVEAHVVVPVAFRIN